MKAKRGAAGGGTGGGERAEEATRTGRGRIVAHRLPAVHRWCEGCGIGFRARWPWHRYCSVCYLWIRIRERHAKNMLALRELDS